jgi:hypothetical protein
VWSDDVLLLASEGKATDDGLLMFVTSGGTLYGGNWKLIGTAGKRVQRVFRNGSGSDPLEV